MSRAVAFLYGVLSYAMFFATFLYLIGFVAARVVPTTIDSGPVAPAWLALLVDLGLIAAFGLQHSVMARPGFKRWWTRIVPEPVERATYVLVSSVLMIGLMAFWQPIPTVIWSFESPVMVWTLTGLSLLGYLTILLSSFAIDHFDLFGLRQVFLHWREKTYTDHEFKTPGIYRLVRHPLYLGWLLAFWATPTLTVGHLLFSSTLTAYIFIAIAYEERDLIGRFGDDYRRYREETSMVLPIPRRRALAEETVTVDSAA